MARTSSITSPTPADGQQMDRSNDPEVTAEMDSAAPEAAMASRRERFAGSAAGVGSVGFEEEGAFDAGAGDAGAGERDPQDGPATDAPPKP